MKRKTSEDELRRPIQTQLSYLWDAKDNMILEERETLQPSTISSID